MDTLTNRELDALVAEKVMGWQRDEFADEPPIKIWWYTTATGRSWLRDYHLPKFSTDIAAAWQVVERIRERAFSVRQMFVLKLSAAISERIWPDNSYRIDPSQVMLHVTPIDICRAALKAIED